MPRIPPLTEAETLADPAARAALEAVNVAHGRITNMKRTLARSPAALRALMSWYELRDEVAPFLGERLTVLFAHAVSTTADCLICSTFFRRMIINAGESPEHLVLNDRERLVTDFARQLAQTPHTVDDLTFERVSAVYSPEQIVALTAFGGLMVATNLVNNALNVDLDEYLWSYQKPVGESAQ